MLTVSCRGKIETSGKSFGIYGLNGLEFTSDVNRVLAFGRRNLIGAVTWDNVGMTLADDLQIRGAETYDEAKAAIYEYFKAACAYAESISVYKRGYIYLDCDITYAPNVTGVRAGMENGETIEFALLDNGLFTDNGQVLITKTIPEFHRISGIVFVLESYRPRRRSTVILTGDSPCESSLLSNSSRLASS